MKAVYKVFGFGALGCLLCCGSTVLLLGGIGAGAAVAEIVNCYRDPLSLVAVGLFVATLLALGFRTWRASKRRACPDPARRSESHTSTQVTEAPIACTLAPIDFEVRLDELKALAQDALISAHRDGLTLHLRYSAEAEQQVRRMVEEEQACCAFLVFDLQSGQGGMDLRITAPEAARQSIDLIYAQFSGESMLGHALEPQ